MPMTQTITAETRQRLTEIINAGLVNGLGKARPGHLCIEAAICLALGEPHSDRPSCVAVPDGDFAIKINDAPWSSPEARAEALLPLALAQLGTAGSDRTAWVRQVAEGMVRQIVPIALRAAASMHPHERHRAALEAAALRCEQEGTGGYAAAYARAAAEDAFAYACAATDYAADAAYDAAHVARNAAFAAAAAIAARATADADSAILAADGAIAAADAAADAASAARDDVLRLAVQIALDAYAAEGRA
jgi:hypothetical protein